MASKKYRQRIWGILFICLSVLSAYASDRDLLMKDINAFYKLVATQKVDMNIQYKLYDKKLEGAPIQASTIKMKLDGNNQYIDNSHYTFYGNKTFQLILYKRNKKAVLSKSNKENKLTQQFNKILPDSVMMEYLKNVNLVSDTLGIRTYQITFSEKAPYKQWTLLFDSKNNTIKKSSIYYKDDVIKEYEKRGLVGEKDASIIPIMVVEYTFHEWNVAPDFFEASDIIAKKQKQYELSKKYSHYKLLDQLSINKTKRN
ncbi:MAG: hypothetical protein V4538_17410 [Bacteroidota bacterium]